MGLADRFDTGTVPVPDVEFNDTMSKTAHDHLVDLLKFAQSKMPINQRFREGMQKAAEIVLTLQGENDTLRTKTAALENFFEFEKLAWELVDKGIMDATEIRDKVAAWANSKQSPVAIRESYAYGLHDMPSMGKVAEAEAGDLTGNTSSETIRQDIYSYLLSRA